MGSLTRVFQTLTRGRAFYLRPSLVESKSLPIHLKYQYGFPPCKRLLLMLTLRENPSLQLAKRAKKVILTQHKRILYYFHFLQRGN